MSRLQALMGKPKMYKIGELELEIKPLKIRDLDTLFELGKEDPKAQATGTRTVLNKVLKEAVPDATDEEIDNISIEHLKELMDAIMEVNKLDISQAKAAFLQDVRRKQTGKPT